MDDYGYYVVRDEDDPGSYHPTWEEAAEVVRYWQRNGYPHAIILG